MIKKILFGLLWFIIFYFFACFVTGAIAGAIAGAKDPQNAAQAGGLAGARAVAAIRIYLALGALVLAWVGAWKEFLPGTRRKNPPPLPPASN
ncbi:MAG TPA: hypothetical protein VK985_10840 [Rariglobus sp.]|nr:hypothetical protein [Rariglobus sp.]